MFLLRKRKRQKIEKNISFVIYIIFNKTKMRVNDFAWTRSSDEEESSGVISVLTTQKSFWMFEPFWMFVEPSLR